MPSKTVCFDEQTTHRGKDKTRNRNAEPECGTGIRNRNAEPESGIKRGIEDKTRNWG